MRTADFRIYGNAHRQIAENLLRCIYPFLDPHPFEFRRDFRVRCCPQFLQRLRHVAADAGMFPPGRFYLDRFPGYGLL